MENSDAVGTGTAHSWGKGHKPNYRQWKKDTNQTTDSGKRTQKPNYRQWVKGHKPNYRQWGKGHKLMTVGGNDTNQTTDSGEKDTN